MINIDMAIKSILSVSVTLLGLSLLSISAVVEADLLRVRRHQPINTAQSTNQQSLSPTDQDQCVSFHHPYCSRFGYNHTVSPNPWARGLTLEQVEVEINHFNSLLNSNCSNVLGIFLCFTYFPLCYGNGQIILPCKEVCDAVHTSRCNDLVLNSVGQWGPHLQCTEFQSKSEIQNGNCADGGQDMTGEKEDVTTTTTQPPVMTEGVKEVTTTEKRKSEADNCEGLKCRSACNVRPKSTGGTFTSSKYKFAAKVLVLQKLANASHCKHAYQVEVIQQFNLSSNEHGVTYAPSMSHHTIVHASPHKCNTCPNLTLGSIYLIAGQYHIGDDGTVIWELPNRKSHSLASAWKGKVGKNYDKKLSGWIADANEHRLQKSTN